MLTGTILRRRMRLMILVCNRPTQGSSAQLVTQLISLMMGSILETAGNWICIWRHWEGTGFGIKVAMATRTRTMMMMMMPLNQNVLGPWMRHVKHINGTCFPGCNWRWLRNPLIIHFGVFPVGYFPPSIYGYSLYWWLYSAWYRAGSCFHLLHTAMNLRYQLHSAFTRGSIHGHIYLEVSMNSSLVNLLKHTPGTQCQNLQCTHIPQEE